MPCISVPYNIYSMFDLGFDNTEFDVNVWYNNVSMKLVVALNIMTNYSNSQVVDILTTFGEYGRCAAER